MNSALAMAQSVYLPRHKAKRKKVSKKKKDALSRTILHEQSPKVIARPASKSVEPYRLPIVRGVSPGVRSPELQHVSSSMDLSLVRLEKLQSKNTSARNEWLAVQERIFALGLRNKCLLDLSVDEAQDLFVGNHYEVLLHKVSKTPLRLPPISRPVE